MQHDEVQAVLIESGPLDDAILSVLGTGEGEWLLQFQSADVLVTHTPSDHRVKFSVIIPGPSVEVEAEAHRALLAHNALWQETGGICFALGAPDGSLQIMADGFDEKLTPQSAAQIASALVAKAEAWSLVLAGTITAEAIAEAADEVTSETVIRV